MLMQGVAEAAAQRLSAQQDPSSGMEQQTVRTDFSLYGARKS
jgi:hypothetical protein